ncbi:DsbA family protein [Aeromonas sp. NJAU223]|uniref:DsbA family protein n=1 Tax=Aeromonas sp. NJAU223 TaxID=3115650 RepID=UPI003DA8C348
MNEMTLHYVYDPLCGWCYGAAPLLEAAARIPGLQIALHAGGLWLGERRQPMGTALRDYVRPHDERIEALTGQPFGQRYFDELLLSEGLLLDSEPPIRAILAVSALGRDGLVMLHRIQQSHYRDGQWVGSLAHLAALAKEQGITAAAFEQAYQNVNLSEHLTESQGWLRRLGGQGYPTLGLEHADKLRALEISSWLGDTEGFITRLRHLLG